MKNLKIRLKSISMTLKKDKDQVSNTSQSLSWGSFKMIVILIWAAKLCASWQRLLQWKNSKNLLLSKKK